MRSLLAVALIAAAASTASAEGYLGLGIGTAASPSADKTSSNGERSGGAFGGMHFGQFSVEGAASRYGVWRGNQEYSGTVLAVAGKYNLKLGDGFDAYGRLGLERTWLSTDTTASDYAGNGWLLGAGFEYHFKLASTGASAFVDYERTQTGLVNQNDMKTQKDTGIGLWTLGVTVSL
jgi:hypothetical protein